VNFETPDGEKWVRYPNDMLIHDLKRTDDTEARWGQTVRIAYTITTPNAPADAKPLDRRRADDPLEFIIGARDAPKGLNMGVMGMRQGSRRRLFLPPELAYGKGGDPQHNIGPDQALIFEIELLSVSGEPQVMPPIMPKAEPLGPPLPGGGAAATTPAVMTP
jgi:FKBP-type peptidyl-prolyl cis-trans isomerase